MHMIAIDVVSTVTKLIRYIIFNKTVIAMLSVWSSGIQLLTVSVIDSLIVYKCQVHHHNCMHSYIIIYTCPVAAYTRPWLHCICCYSIHRI